MAQAILALITGTLFGFGLALSQMVNPEKVLAFLDLAGNWDPSLALVMGGAVAVTLVAFPFVTRRSRPLFSGSFQLPSLTAIDRRLVIGSALFGIGWGIGGYCPGPALAAFAVGSWEPFVFVPAMIAGSLTWRRIAQLQARRAAVA